MLYYNHPKGNPRKETKSKAKGGIHHVGKNVISPALTEGGKRALQNIAQAKIQEIFGIRVGKNGPEVVALSRPNNDD